MSVVGHRTENASPTERATVPVVERPQSRRLDSWWRKPAGSARRSAALWALATPAVVLLAACLPLVGTSDFYFWDDTEIGGFPLYFHLGELLRAGTWPVLDPGMWMGGNFIAEGQWGLWNPMILAIGVAASAANSAVVFSTVLKLAFLMVAALGAFLLARSYNVRPQLAFAAGVAVPLNGFTLYMDAPDWASGLMTWSMLPYAWLALRRSNAKNASPVAFLVVAYLIVTVGYVQGTIGLCLVLLAVGIDRLCARDWRAAQRVMLGAVFVVLLGITVYLPAMLSADVTLRSNDEVLNTGLLTADLGGLVSSGIPTAVFAVSGWWGEWTTTPMLYTTWFLPVLAFVSWTRVRPQLAEVRDVAIVLLGAAMFVVGPSDAGALRYPMRFMPYVALAGIIGLLVLLDEVCLRRRAARRSAEPSGWCSWAATSATASGQRSVASCSGPSWSWHWDCWSSGCSCGQAVPRRGRQRSGWRSSWRPVRCSASLPRRRCTPRARPITTTCQNRSRTMASRCRSR